MFQSKKLFSFASTGKKNQNLKLNIIIKNLFCFFCSNEKKKNLFKKIQSPYTSKKAAKVLTNLKNIEEIKEKTTTTTSNTTTTNPTEELSIRQQQKGINVRDELYQYLKKNKLYKTFNSERLQYRKSSAPVTVDERPESERANLWVPEGQISFLGAAKNIASFLPELYPEIAFIGRSNVGKSSLLNALTENYVAKVSAKPGMTQSINWFYFEKLKKAVVLVDLPGYGFAFADEEKQKNWQELTRDFFIERKNLKRVFVLVDCRILNLKQSDVDLMDYLNLHGIKFQIVLTKVDEVELIDVARRVMFMEQKLKYLKHCIQKILVVSSKNGAGIVEVQKEINKFLVDTKTDLDKKGIQNILSGNIEPTPKDEKAEKKKKENKKKKKK